MEYSTAMVLILITYIIAIINIKMFILGILMTIIDIIVMLPEPISSGQVIVGYLATGSVLTPLIVSYSWIQIIAVIGILLCIMTTVLKMVGVFDGI